MTIEAIESSIGIAKVRCDSMALEVMEGQDVDLTAILGIFQALLDDVGNIALEVKNRDMQTKATFNAMRICVKALTDDVEAIKNRKGCLTRAVLWIGRLFESRAEKDRRFLSGHS